MERFAEIEYKHQQLTAFLDAQSADGLWLRRPPNLAWITGGGDAIIAPDSEHGVYSILITPEQRIIYTDNIEAPRLKREEGFEALGFGFRVFDWWQPTPPDLPHLIHDLDPAIEQKLQTLRSVLCSAEQDRYRALGHDAAQAIEAAARGIRVGETEFQIAARLDAECRARSGKAIVNLVAVDERIRWFRHPLPTAKPLQTLAMLVVCMQRDGLVAAATRFASLGPAPDTTRRRLHKIARIDAQMMQATRPGRTLGQVFSDLQTFYIDQNEALQWRYHHQGGSIGYQSRERIAVPGDITPIQAAQGFAWNPSIEGAKSEDTILITETGFEVLTQGDYPTVTIDVDGHLIDRPDILEVT